MFLKILVQILNDEVDHIIYLNAFYINALHKLDHWDQINK